MQKLNRPQRAFLTDVLHMFRILHGTPKINRIYSMLQGIIEKGSYTHTEAATINTLKERWQKDIDSLGSIKALAGG